MHLSAKGKNFRLVPLFLLVFLVLASACGKDSDTGIAGVTSDCLAPAGSTITVMPVDPEIAITGYDVPYDLWVIVSYPDKTPMPKACVTITGAFASVSPTPLYTFDYYPVNDPKGPVYVQSGFTAQTDNSGVYRFSIFIPSSTVLFEDDIVVRSGTASGQTHIKYNIAAV